MVSLPEPTAIVAYAIPSVADHVVVAAAAVHDVVAGAVGDVVHATSVADHKVIAAAAVYGVVAGADGVCRRSRL